MKKISTLLCAAAAVVAISAPAAAADMRMPMKAPPVAAAVFSWTGFYIGVNGGGAFGTTEDVIITERTNAGALVVGAPWPGFGNFGPLEMTGGFGGGQLGYNWQAPGSNWVFGIETDLQGASIKDSTVATLPYIGAATVTAGASNKVEWFGTLRGRLGVAFDRVLLYGTAGLAYGNSKATIAFADSLGFTAAATDDSTRVGWVAGAGVEWAFAPNWSLKGEYQYIDLGKRTISAQEFLGAVPTVFNVSTEVRTDFHTGRIGVNYRF